MSKGQKIVSIVTVLVVLVAGAVLFGKLSAKKVTPTTADAGNRTAVQVQQVKISENAAVMSFKATLEPVDEGIVSSKTAGRVEQILFEDGQKVTQGEPLVQLDDQELGNQLKTAEANLQSLEINLESAQRSYDRMKQLFDSQAIAKSDFQNAETALKTAKANLNSANVNIESLRDALANAIIRAPISGTMDEKSVNLGQYVSPGTVMAKVKNISSVNAVIQVKQSDANYISVGQKAQVKFDENNPTVYEGVVKSIDVAANPSARVFDCKVQISNQEQSLHPGIFARVEIGSGQNKKIVAVPIIALTGSEGNYAVFVADNGVARRRSVIIGELYQDVAEVKSGLQEGENVIITNLNMLQDGDAVAVAGQGA